MIPTPVPTVPFAFLNVNGLNNQLAAVQFYTGAYHPTDPTNLLGGTQDNGTQSSGHDLTNWFMLSEATEAHAESIPAQPNVQWGSVYNLAFLDPLNLPLYPFARTDDYWNSSTDMSLYTGDDVEPFLLMGKINTADPTQYYTGTNYLYNHTEGLPSGSPNWSKYRQRFLNTGYILAIANAPTDARTLYVGTTDGTLWFLKMRERPGAASIAWATPGASLPFHHRHRGEPAQSAQGLRDRLRHGQFPCVAL